MTDKFVVSTNEIGEIIVTDVETDRVYRYGDISKFFGLIRLLNEQQATINELQSIINHIKCEENCEDYDYCCETVCSLYDEIKHLKEENEQLRQKLDFYLLDEFEWKEKYGD